MRLSICRSKDTELSQRIDAIENGSSNEIPYKADFIATGSNDIELPLNVYAKNVFINKLPLTLINGHKLEEFV
jgi:hypothetical protein